MLFLAAAKLAALALSWLCVGIACLVALMIVVTPLALLAKAIDDRLTARRAIQRRLESQRSPAVLMRRRAF